MFGKIVGWICEIFTKIPKNSIAKAAASVLDTLPKFPDLDYSQRKVMVKDLIARGILRKEDAMIIMNASKGELYFIKYLLEYLHFMKSVLDGSRESSPFLDATLIKGLSFEANAALAVAFTILMVFGIGTYKAMLAQQEYNLIELISEAYTNLQYWSIKYDVPMFDLRDTLSRTDLQALIDRTNIKTGRITSAKDFKRLIEYFGASEGQSCFPNPTKPQLIK